MFFFNGTRGQKIKKSGSSLDSGEHVCLRRKENRGVIVKGNTFAGAAKKMCLNLITKKYWLLNSFVPGKPFKI